MTDMFMVFFRKGACDLHNAHDLLVEARFSVTCEGDELFAKWGTSQEFRISYSAESWVREEAAEIGQGTPHEEAMKLCDARFEVYLEDLDEALDEINTLIDLQLHLQAATQGYLFLSWNGNLSGPEQD